MISIHTWVYEDGDVHISVDVQRHRTALARKPNLSAVEKIALLSMIAEELNERFPDAHPMRNDGGAVRLAIEQATALTDLRQETSLDWDREKCHPFVPNRS